MSSAFITCAVTGSGDTVGKSDKVPFTPEAIANDCIAAAKAGAAIAGGNVRVGLEDNLYLDRGQLATNHDLVERAAAILSGMNIDIMNADDVRKKMQLTRHG